MENKRFYMLALSLAFAGSLTLSGCSSSEVSEDGDIAEMSPDELPVVDAETDLLPNSLEQPDGDAVADSASELSPEASVDVPMEAPADQDPEANALADAVATTEPAFEPENGPSLEAPPSMNEVAPPVAAYEPEPATNYTAPTSHSGGGDHSYAIQTGDTLMKIAYKCYGDIYQWKRVLEDNRDRISNPNSLVAGTELKVDQPAQEESFSGFERYLIKNGDTLGTISGDVYGTTSKWRKLWEQNDKLIKDPNRIYAGFFLKYSVSSDDRMETERLKQMKQDPAPLAATPSTVREPSSDQEAMAPAQEPAPTTQN